MRNVSDPATAEKLVPALNKLLHDAAVSESPAPSDTEQPELHALLSDAVRSRATDIHVDPREDGYSVRLRIDGDLHETIVIDRGLGNRLINQFKTRADIDPVQHFTPVESRCKYSLEGRNISLRVTAVSATGGDKVAVRLLNSDRADRQLDELGIDSERLERIHEWMASRSGMFLVTGPTGSGKTTTLYALLHVFRKRTSHIVTIEDPVEVALPDVTQLQMRPAQGFTFTTGLKAMLRLDPDYLMVGEIRDRESAQAAADAATSGRVLLSSMHSSDVAEAITSLHHWGLQPNIIQSTLSLVVAQRLVRTLCKECHEEVPPDEDERHWLRSAGAEDVETVWHAVGCVHCNGLGYHGRTGVFEVCHLTDDDNVQMMQNWHAGAIRSQLRQTGHRFLVDDALAKVRAGVTSLSEIRPILTLGL